MRRLFWLGVGISVGALVVRRMSDAAARLTPDRIATSLTHALTDLAESLRDFARDVRAAMHEREEQLRAGSGLDGTLGKADGT